MAFLIENGTGSPLSIDDLGITLEVGETTELATRTQPQEVALSMETGNELHTLVSSGDVVVKDPLTGVSDLSVAEAIDCLRSINDPHYRVGAGARIGDISDVDLTGLADNYILEYDSGSGDWIATLNSGGTGVANAIADVNADSGTFSAVGEDSFDIVGGTGITTAIVGDVLTITNDAPDQNLWETFVADTGSTTANTTTDTLTVSGGASISTAIVGDVLTITNDAPNVDQNIWETVTADSGSAVANTTTDTLTISGGTAITTAIVGDVLTITNNAPNVDQNLWETIVADSGSTTANSTTDTLSILTTAGLNTSIVGDTLTISPGNDLGAIEALNTNAILVRTGTDTWAARSLTQPAAGITISNADGVSGNPTFALANDLAAVEGLATTGLAVRTGADTWTTRGMVGTTQEIDVTNGDGVAGNPLVALSPNTAIPGTEGINLPAGTTAERPVSPEIGDMRFNTTTNSYEAWDGVQWVIFGSVIGSGVKEIKFGQLDHLQGTTQVPYDDTPPLISEGTEFFTEDIAIGVDSGRVLIWLSTIVSISNASRKITISLWRDSTLIGVTAVSVASSNDPATTTFIEVDAPGVAGTYTYSGRIGVSASGTWRIGGWTADADYGGPSNTNNQYVVMRVE
jgi:hypothetical protein